MNLYPENETVTILSCLLIGINPRLAIRKIGKYRYPEILNERQFVF